MTDQPQGGKQVSVAPVDTPVKYQGKKRAVGAAFTAELEHVAQMIEDGVLKVVHDVEQLVDDIFEKTNAEKKKWLELRGVEVPPGANKAALEQLISDYQAKLDDKPDPFDMDAPALSTWLTEQDVSVAPDATLKDMQALAREALAPKAPSQ